MRHSHVPLSCSSREAKAAPHSHPLCASMCPKECCSWVGNVLHGQNRWEFGTAEQSHIPLELGTDICTSGRQCQMRSPGARTCGLGPSCSTRCCNSHKRDFNAYGLAFNHALILEVSFAPWPGLFWTVQLSPHHALSEWKSSKFTFNALHWSDLCFLW